MPEKLVRRTTEVVTEEFFDEPQQEPEPEEQPEQPPRRPQVADVADERAARPQPRRR